MVLCMYNAPALPFNYVEKYLKFWFEREKEMQKL